MAPAVKVSQYYGIRNTFVIPWLSIKRTPHTSHITFFLITVRCSPFVKLYYFQQFIFCVQNSPCFTDIVYAILLHVKNAFHFTPRYYGLSLLRALNDVLERVRRNESWLYYQIPTRRWPDCNSVYCLFVSEHLTLGRPMHVFAFNGNTSPYWNNAILYLLLANGFSKMSGNFQTHNFPIETSQFKSKWKFKKRGLIKDIKAFPNHHVPTKHINDKSLRRKQGFDILMFIAAVHSPSLGSLAMENRL